MSGYTNNEVAILLRDAREADHELFTAVRELCDTFDSEGRTPGVVIGRDAKVLRVRELLAKVTP